MYGATSQCPLGRNNREEQNQQPTGKHFHRLEGLVAYTRMKAFCRVKYWKIIAERLTETGWNWGCVTHIDDASHSTLVVEAHRQNGHRYVVRSDEKVTAFAQLERDLMNLEAPPQ